jgi:ribonuclease G
MGIGAALTRACVSCAGSGRMKTPETVAAEALSEVRRVSSVFATEELTVRAHPDVARLLRLVLQTTAPVVDRALIERLRVLDDPGSRPDQFDVNAS